MSKRLPHGLLGLIDSSCRLHGQAAIGSDLDVLRSSGHDELKSLFQLQQHRRCAGQERERRCSVKADGEKRRRCPEGVGEAQHLNATLQVLGFLLQIFNPMFPLFKLTATSWNLGVCRLCPLLWEWHRRHSEYRKRTRLAVQRPRLLSAYRLFAWMSSSPPVRRLKDAVSPPGRTILFAAV